MLKKRQRFIDKLVISDDQMFGLAAESVGHGLFLTHLPQDSSHVRNFIQVPGFGAVGDERRAPSEK